MSEVKRYGVLSGNLTDGTSGFYTQVIDARHYDAAQSELAALREELTTAKRSLANCKLALDAQTHNYGVTNLRLTAAEQRNAELLEIAEGLTIQLHATIGNTEHHEDCMRDLAALKPTESGASGSTCNQIREELGLLINNPCIACNNGACIDR